MLAAANNLQQPVVEYVLFLAISGGSLNGLLACAAGALAIAFTATASNHAQLVWEYVFVFPHDWPLGPIPV